MRYYSKANQMSYDLKQVAHRVKNSPREVVRSRFNSVKKEEEQMTNGVTSKVIVRVPAGAESMPGRERHRISHVRPKPFHF